MTATSEPVPLSQIDLPPLDLTQPTAEQIHSALRKAILSLSLPPGTRISEAEAGQRFGASRTPVREAMTWLRDEGLIVTFPSRGNFVTRFSEPAIRSAQFIREALEMAAVTLICESGLSPEHDQRLTEALAAQAKAIENSDAEAFHAADDAFHATIASATNMPRIETLVSREKTALDRLRALRLNDTEHLRQLADEHGRIANALRKANLGRAQRILTPHLRGVLGVLESLKSEHRDYFE
ncbi:GntR family transcriptional regulator [Maritalea mobilis]|uniref:GntR family transcriptional regulator n=1 Tax=[Roseibacterium] beibuensis TaxID=1193142 RepID=A0ABP9LEN2_9RHOB|nr:MULTISPECIES: GntR family transcriptional regulator [Alphaproteobacteria]MBY6201720.1 GntR family transcriptional regulator [Maritalea mobilis]MCS6623270.1 GntR family transcriptional regulator [Roseibacterium beibuensis]